MAEDRNLLERTQDYLTSGRFDKDVRYVLGPHLSSGLQGLINLFGPQADIKAMVDEAEQSGRSFRKGDSLGGITSLITAAAAPFLIGTPGSVTSLKNSRREVSKNLPKHKKGLKSVEIDDDLFKDVLKTPKGDPVVVYRGVPSGSEGLEPRMLENILEGRPKKWKELNPDLEKPFYFTEASFLSDNPDIAASYAGKGMIMPFILKPKRVIEYGDTTRGQRDKYYQREAGRMSKGGFAEEARNIGEGEVLVARNVLDTGPRLRQFDVEPKHWSRGGDIYATSDENVLLSAINPGSRKAKLPVKINHPSELFSKEKNSIGVTTFSGDTYSSFEVPMTKTKFLDNTEKLDTPKKESIEFLKQGVQQGKKLGVPHIVLKWDGVSWKPVKSSYNGRHHMIVAEDFLGKNVEVPVNVQLRNKAGEKIPIHELFPVGNIRYRKVRDSEEAKKMLDEFEKWKNTSTNKQYRKITPGIRSSKEAEKLAIERAKKRIKKKKGGGSVMERNPYNHLPKAI